MKHVPLFFVLAFTCTSVLVAQQTGSLESDFEAYLSLAGAKAFAFASNEAGDISWGYAHSHTTVETAIRYALRECRAQAVVQKVAVDCMILASDSTLVAEPIDKSDRKSQPRSDVITYDVHWENGRKFTIGASREFQVWVSLSPLREASALVYLVNASDQPITFDPQTLELSITRESRRGTVREVRKTFAAEEWENKVRRRHALAAGLMAASPKTSA